MADSKLHPFLVSILLTVVSSWSVSAEKLMMMTKKHFKCPECGYEFDAEVSFLQDKYKTGLSGLGIGAAVGFMLGGPVGAVVGATFGGKRGKRTPKLMDNIRCPKCNHCC